MQFRALAPFGVEISDLGVESVSASTIDEIQRRIAAHRVAVFRSQTIDDAGFVSFLRRFGELMFTQGEIPVADAPDLNVVSNAGRTVSPRSVFHTDTSYVARPPAYTALRAVEVPTKGGCTEFTDQVEAARRLPPAFYATLHGRTIRHGATGVPDAETAHHPILRRHPITNETALFLSTPERCTEISGLVSTLSRSAVAALYRHSTRDELLYRHFWRAGDIVMWDNRVTMHRANHAGVEGMRILHRGMVRGEEPIAA